MKRNNPGFTLLELLIAVTIFSIVALALYSSFHAGIRILQRAQEAMEFHQDVRVVMEELSLDLRNSLLSPLHETAEATPIAETEEEESKPIYFFLGEERKFTLVTLKDYFSEDGRLRQEICNVTYYFEGGDTSGLMRITRYQGKGFTERPGGEEALLTGIEDMTVQYSFEGEDEDSPPEWLSVWEEEEKVPLGVKIKFKLKGLSGLRRLTKTVFIPVGALGEAGEGEI